jgi:hypothetical protein
MNLERLCQTLEARLERAIAQREELRVGNERLREAVTELARVLAARDLIVCVSKETATILCEIGGFKDYLDQIPRATVVANLSDTPGSSPDNSETAPLISFNFSVGSSAQAIRQRRT